MDKIVMYCRLSNERDSAYQIENEESIETVETEQTDEDTRR